MKLGYTILYVTSVPETVAFYEAAFGLNRKMVLDSGDYGELDTGETTLAFAATAFIEKTSRVPFRPTHPNEKAPAVEIALVTDDVESAFATAVAAGAVAVNPPAAKPWGQVVGYVRDNNGFLVELCSPLSEPD